MRGLIDGLIFFAVCIGIVFSASRCAYTIARLDCIGKARQPELCK